MTAIAIANVGIALLIIVQFLQQIQGCLAVRRQTLLVKLECHRWVCNDGEMPSMVWYRVLSNVKACPKYSLAAGRDEASADFAEA